MSIKSEVQGFDISKNSAVIIGCGGLGTNAAVHLAGSGIGKLLLVDFDGVEKRNLNRQFFYTENDEGSAKCELLAKRLKAYAPECEIDCINERIEYPDFAEGYDIIVIAVDNIETRKNVNEYCKKSGVPCVNGNINRGFGMAYLFIPGKTPDLEAAGCLNETNNKMRSPSTTAGIIGATEAALAIDYFLGRTQNAGKLYLLDNNEIQTLEIRGDELD